MSEPTTPTGKRVRANYPYPFLWDDILAIEDEARRQERDRMSEPMAILRLDAEVTPERVEEIRQDLQDGAALRRLRQAIEGWELKGITIGWEDPEAWEPGGFTVRCSGEMYYGTTIAEAADKCREALEGHSGTG